MPFIISFTVMSGLISLTLLLRWLSPRKERHPPGPFALPIIGNIHQLTNRPWRQFADWSRIHRSPILRIDIAGQIAIVVGTHKAAADLLERRSAIYSDRPSTSYVTSELLTGGLVFAFQHNDLAKRMRRGAHEGLNNHIPERFFRLMENEAVILVNQFLQTPELYDRHLRRASASFAMSLTYGRPPLFDSEDKSIAQIIDFSERVVTAAAPGAFLVNSKYFAWMKHLPAWMCGWRRYADHWFKHDASAFEAMYSDAERRLANGDGDYTLTASITRDGNKLKLTRRELAWLCVSVLAGGTETTSGTMAWFILSMMLYPEVQKKAQEEIDHVVGRDRLPNLQDEEHLPYIRAVVREVMRWRSVAPLGVPHALQQDDVYEGYFLPKGATILVNVWSIHRDPAIFGDDADKFRPERHLDKEGKLNVSAFKDTHDEGHLSFGFGRRFCVGRNIANHNLFIQMACILWSFTISPGKDRDGNIVIPDPDNEIVDGIVVRPPVVPISIMPRFSGAKGIIEHSLSRVEDEYL